MKLILSFIVISAFIACNNPKDPCANVICKDYQECVNGVCQCNPGTYDMKNWCMPTYSEHAYIFISTSGNCKSNCFPSDTAIVELSKSLGNDPNNDNGSFQLSFTKDVSRSHTAVSGEISYYYKRMDGDSFRVFAPNNLFICNEGGVKRNFPVINCKLNLAKDSLKLKIVWHDAVNATSTGKRIPIDSCTKLFTR
jgi:hypothetical protein